MRMLARSVPMFRLTWARKLRRIAAGLAVLVVLVLALEIVGGSYAKARAVEAAAKQGLSIQVGSARIGFLSVVLKDIDGGFAGDESLKVHLPELRVSLSAGLKVESVLVQGGVVHAAGSFEHLRDVFQARRSAGAETEGHHRSIALRAENVELDFSMRERNEG